MKLSCSVEFTRNELQQFCESANAQSKTNLRIFRQIINNFNHIGKFGNADFYYNDDWTPVLKEEISSMLNGNDFKWD